MTLLRKLLGWLRREPDSLPEAFDVAFSATLWMIFAAGLPTILLVEIVGPGLAPTLLLCVLFVLAMLASWQRTGRHWGPILDRRRRRRQRRAR
ncbi:MAG: hypothetical protein Q8K79_07350 [Solirubrobacteraceae bacterium]|nr:hypothetical protein [Solirubrobacteraceae bacterium]